MGGHRSSASHQRPEAIIRHLVPRAESRAKPELPKNYKAHQLTRQLLDSSNVLHNRWFQAAAGVTVGTTAAVLSSIFPASVGMTTGLAAGLLMGSALSRVHNALDAQIMSAQDLAAVRENFEERLDSFNKRKIVFEPLELVNVILGSEEGLEKGMGALRAQYQHMRTELEDQDSVLAKRQADILELMNNLAQRNGVAPIQIDLTQDSLETTQLNLANFVERLSDAFPDQRGIFADRAEQVCLLVQERIRLQKRIAHLNHVISNELPQLKNALGAVRQTFVTKQQRIAADAEDIAALAHMGGDVDVSLRQSRELAGVVDQAMQTLSDFANGVAAYLEVEQDEQLQLEGGRE